MMESIYGLFTISGLMTLLMLILLQAVLGFDNLLYISLESQRVEEKSQQKVRRLGIGMAIFLRIALLFVVKGMVEAFEDPFFEIHHKWITCTLNLESLVVILGGAFILYTALKEIYHMLSMHDLSEGSEKKATRSVASAIFWIVLMNLVFSFDSILSAMALTKDMKGEMAIMSVAIIISGVLMIVLADHVSEFLKRNRMYEVLGLFILFIVGVMLVSEGGHKAGLSFFGEDVHAMPKSTFYFVVGVLVIVDIVQSKYQKKLAAIRAKNTTA